MKETEPTPAATRWTSMFARLRPRTLFLLILLVLAATPWAIYLYRNLQSNKSEVLVFHVCLGNEQKLCPGDVTFVRNQGEDTLTRWAQQQCPGYKARRIIVNDGPSKDCNCSLADITCSTEY